MRARVFGHCLLSQFFPPRSFVEHASFALWGYINAKYFVFAPVIVLTDEPVQLLSPLFILCYVKLDAVDEPCLLWGSFMILYRWWTVTFEPLLHNGMSFFELGALGSERDCLWVEVSTLALRWLASSTVQTKHNLIVNGGFRVNDCSACTRGGPGLLPGSCYSVRRSMVVASRRNPPFCRWRIWVW